MRGYRIKQQLLMLSMIIINIVFNIFLLILHILFIIPSMFWKLKDYRKIEKFLFYMIPQLPDYDEYIKNEEDEGGLI